MPWYYGVIFVFLLFTGCNNQPQIGQKIFDKEDEYILKGILAENNNSLKEAENTFSFLYNKTNKYIYFKELIKLNFYQNNYIKTIKLVDKFIEKYPQKELEVINYKIYSYIKMDKLNKALNLTFDILHRKRSLEIYKIVAFIYIQKKNYKEAIKYLKSVYSISKSPKVLSEMGDIFFKYLKNPNEAISYYQTHIRLYGCNILICTRLAEVYKFLYDYENLISIYKKLYLATGNNEYANKIVYIYLEQKKYQKAIKFVESHHLNKYLLYLIYKNKLEQTHNYRVAYKLYKMTRKNRYFFLYSVYKFEQSKKGLLNIRNLIYNLNFLIKKERNPVYLNYLGYILIDYDINVKRGVKLVKEAVKNNPSDEFLDSLAWGYYKLHKCKKAWKIILKIKEQDKEIEKHKKMIRRCYDIRKNNKKNKRKLKKK